MHIKFCQYINYTGDAVVLRRYQFNWGFLVVLSVHSSHRACSRPILVDIPLYVVYNFSIWQSVWKFSSQIRIHDTDAFLSY